MALTWPVVASSSSDGRATVSKFGTLNANQSLRTFRTVSPIRLLGLLPLPSGLPLAAILLPISTTIVLSSTALSAVGGHMTTTLILGALQLALTKSPKGRISTVCF